LTKNHYPKECSDFLNFCIFGNRILKPVSTSEFKNWPFESRPSDSGSGSQRQFQDFYFYFYFFGIEPWTKTFRRYSGPRISFFYLRPSLPIQHRYANTKSVKQNTRIDGIPEPSTNTNTTNMYRQRAAQDLLPQNSPDFVTVNLNRADGYFPDSESLSKRGFVGKLAAKHRPRLICVGVFASSIAFLLFVLWFIFLIFQSLRVRASGIDIASVDGAHASGPVAINGVPVLGIVEPAGQMSDTTHALMLLEDERFANYSRLTAEELKLGYLAWTAASDRPRVNFTLAHAEKLVREQTDRNETTCVCYAEYGLPYNIVYMPGDDEVLYEPRIVQEFTERVVRIRSECSLHSLIEETKRRLHNGEDEEPRRIESGKEHFMTTNSSGIVEWLRVDGRRSRKQLDLPEFPCVKHCVRFFED